MAIQVTGFRLPSGSQAVWMAVVVINPVIRVTANIVIRLYKGWKIRLFATEEDAVRWLDERDREHGPGTP